MVPIKSRRRNRHGGTPSLVLGTLEYLGSRNGGALVFVAFIGIDHLDVARVEAATVWTVIVTRTRRLTGRLDMIKHVLVLGRCAV